MEFLQAFQFITVDQCSNPWNKFLTVLGWLHICYQPFFTHIITSSVEANPKLVIQYQAVLRLCFLGGTLLFGRWILAEFFPHYFPVTPFSSDLTTFLTKNQTAILPATKEWLRGEQLCTFMGEYHLAWSIPLADVTYWIPSVQLHSFMMFGPFFIMGDLELIIQGILLAVTGPLLASYFTSNLMEQGAIWCFFSITQISIMLIIVFQVSPELVYLVHQPKTSKCPDTRAC